MSRRPGYHLLYEDNIEPCLICGGAGRTDIQIIRNDRHEVIRSIYCIRCGLGFQMPLTYNHAPYEVIREVLIEHWNNNDNWQSLDEEVVRASG